MTLEEVNRIASLIHGRIDYHTAQYRIMHFHLRKALIEFWSERCPDHWVRILHASADLPAASKTPAFKGWCLSHLGYVPALEDDQIVFKTPADETLFYLRWHNVED